MTPEAYVDMVLSELATSGVIASFEVAERWTSFDRGYIRVRARHVNGDFLELAEYFVLEDETPVTQRYRYQWMDEHRQVLRRRYLLTGRGERKRRWPQESLQRLEGLGPLEGRRVDDRGECGISFGAPLGAKAAQDLTVHD